MISVSDIAKLLEQIPVWRTLRELPRRVDRLETEIGNLHSRIDELNKAPKTAPGETCKACGKPAVRRTSSAPSKGPFGELGARDEIWTCQACGDTETRLVNAG